MTLNEKAATEVIKGWMPPAMRPFIPDMIKALRECDDTDAEVARLTAKLAAIRDAIDHPGRDVHSGQDHVNKIRQVLES